MTIYKQIGSDTLLAFCKLLNGDILMHVKKLLCASERSIQSKNILREIGKEHKYQCESCKGKSVS